jgi:hypothetical protein
MTETFRSHHTAKNEYLEGHAGVLVFSRSSMVLLYACGLEKPAALA